jgi:hypothetical protein
VSLLLATTDHPEGIRPLLGAGGLVLADGHPICGVCGTAVQSIRPDRWRHVSKGRRFPRRSKWLSPITLAELRKLQTYEDFKARFPWAVRADLGDRFVTSEDHWREGRRRLERYHAALATVRRWRKLRAGENPYLELITILADAMTPDWRLPYGLAQMLDLRERRRELAALFSWAIPTDEALDVLAGYAPLVECGAGMGYWTALLRARGVEAVAYDLVPPGGHTLNAYHKARRAPWTRVHQSSSVAAVRRHRGHTLVLCWPPYADDAASYATLRAYRGDVVIYIGERDEGATGSVRFHRELRLNWTLIEAVELPHWPRLRDRLMVYRRNATRRPHRERDRCFECKRFIRTGAIGRCDACVERRPPGVALRLGDHRVEYPQEALDAMPPAMRRAFEESPNRIR